MASRDGGSASLSSIAHHRSVEEITKASQQYEYNAQVPLRYWLRTAAALLKEADIYRREGDEETTYLLLFRHAHLVLANLAEHPGRKELEMRSQLAKANQEVNGNLKILELLKDRIKQRHERYSALARDREARGAEILKQSASAPTSAKQKPDQRLSRTLKQLHGHEDRDLAVTLARREFERRSGQLSKYGANGNGNEGDDLSRTLQAIRPPIDPTSSSETRRPLGTVNSSYNYPSVRAPPSTVPLSRNNIVEQRRQTLATPPALPPKSRSLEDPVAPPRPGKILSQGDSEASAAQDSQPTYTFASTAALENGAPLRTLFLPPTLRTTFLRLAHKNTLANLETCAFLAGTLISNALFVSKLIVPAQVSTSDTCEMTNESQLFDYVDSERDLMVLGWIHTHPTQTCFMSSRDLHTHAGYQMMLSESIAIVCAPSKGDTTHGGDWGVYRLTDPPGKMAILNCTKPGIFHPHDVDHIYTDALRPGHVVEAKGLEFEVVDLRDA